MTRIADPVSVEEGYERWAASYDRDPNPLLAREERHLFPLLRKSSGKRMLDVACGTGRWLGHLGEQGTAIGIDSSNAMLQAARSKSAVRAQFVRGTCSRMPFCEGVFDLAICSFALAHLSDLSSTAEELARVLRRDSTLFISDLHPDALSQGWQVGFRHGSGALEIETFLHPAESVVQTFCSAGFACLSVESLWLGDAEQPIFEQSGKSNYFREACEIPAVIVFHFRRAGVLPSCNVSRKALS